ncbi:MAG TPA: flagellar hook capping FlgD N-terminal domain-containing protein [Solirubrobacteraceae bacterium]|jgi:flagellar basal-body rod modification protein FlgD
MTQVSGLLSSNTAASQSAQASGNPGANLDKDDFLKLFVAQMQHQDPTKPMDDAAMMGQMAQFSTLEQMSNMAAVNEAVAVTLVQGQSIGLIGKTVTYVDDADVQHSGVVEKVTTAGGASKITVGGVEIDPSTVISVGEATPDPAVP